MSCAKTIKIAPPNVQVVHDGAYFLQLPQHIAK